MKGSTIVAMVLAAAAASAATVVALKKAHDKKQAEEFDDYEILHDESAEDEVTEACNCNVEEEADACCADGVCSFDADENESDAVDQPAQIHMPEGFDAEETAEDEKKSDTE